MEPKLIEKPWGKEEIWGNVPGKYLGKTIHINMKNRLSLQYHNKKEETIYVIRGVLSLHLKNKSTNKVETIKLGPGECYHIHPGQIHRFAAENGDVVLSEVSTYYPNDVVRLEDDYDRK
jgi:mannose-6-phosphate isomerase